MSLLLMKLVTFLSTKVYKIHHLNFMHIIQQSQIYCNMVTLKIWIIVENLGENRKFLGAPELCSNFFFIRIFSTCQFTILEIYSANKTIFFFSTYFKFSYYGYYYEIFEKNLGSHLFVSHFIIILNDREKVMNSCENDIQSITVNHIEQLCKISDPKII